MVQVTFSCSQIMRARSTLKPAGLPSGPGKSNGGESFSVRKRIWVMRVRSGRSGRRRGSQKPGTVRSGLAAGAGAFVCARAAGAGPSARTAMRAMGAARIAQPKRRCHAVMGSQITAQIGGGVFRGALEIERRDEAAVLVHQVDERGVVHGVVAVVERHLLHVDAIFLGNRGDRRRIAGEAEQVRIEA